MSKASYKSRLRELFQGKGKNGLLFNRFLLVVNILAIFLFLLEPAIEIDITFHAMEIFFGCLFLAEYLGRLWVADRRISFFFGLINLLDLIVIASLFTPVLIGNFGFLRVVRSLRILRTYRFLTVLETPNSWFKKNEDVVTSSLNLFVFIFIMTDIVFVMQADKNDSINSYVDALYFTLTTLTTTGFGDITLHGSTGKLVAILIMVFGITLFVKLARDIIRPSKVHYECPDCGLLRHDYDATHCKHCGRTIHIETEGG